MDKENMKIDDQQTEEVSGGKAVPCLYCDYWRNITDFE